MKKINLFLFLILSTGTFAAETCYQVTRVQSFYSENPEVLCVSKNPNQPLTVITLKFRNGNTEQTVATFHMNHFHNGSSHCEDCNEQYYAIATPSNCSFNALAIKFDGTIDRQGRETGMIYIGDITFYYRKL